MDLFLYSFSIHLYENYSVNIICRQMLEVSLALCHFKRAEAEHDFTTIEMY